MRFLLVIEKTPTGYSAYSPDLDGCVATRANRGEVERRMKEAIEFHLEGMKAGGYAVPSPQGESTYVDNSA